MIVKDRNILFLHPGKSGGTSIEAAFFNGKNPGSFSDFQKRYLRSGDRSVMFGWDSRARVYLQHADLRICKQINLDFNDYTTITIVRRPIERVLSAYFYSGRGEKKEFNKFVIEDLEKVYKANIVKGYTINHFGPQHWYTQNGNYKVDHIIKLDTIEEDCKKLDIKLHNRKYAQTTASRKYKKHIDAYNKETLEKIYSIYEQDFDIFKFKKE